MTPCTICRNRLAETLSGLCMPCDLEVRLEASRGMRRFEEYLADWAAFADWDSSSGAVET